MEKAHFVINERLRLILARLEGALGIRFRLADIERVFSDKIDDQVSAKSYSFYEVGKIRVAGLVKDYEPESIWLCVEVPWRFVKRVRAILYDDLGP